jgi:hypothetical protein
LTRGVSSPGERSASDDGRYSLMATSCWFVAFGQVDHAETPGGSFLTIW